MLHEIGVDMYAQLVAQGCPFPVYDGPERRPTTTYARERIVIEHDDDSNDSFPSGPHKATRNPRSFLTRNMAAKIRIYAQEPRPGAFEFEHRRRAEHVLDMVLVALEKVAKTRKNLWLPTSGKFIQPEDLGKSEVVGGAVYELKFWFDRGVDDYTWTLAGPPTATIPNVGMQGNPSLTFAATGHTITRAAGSWLTDGFAIGQTVVVAGTHLNDGVKGAITALTASVMTFASGITNEGPISGVSVSSVFFKNSQAVADNTGGQVENF
jgi:hypothetical protein